MDDLTGKTEEEIVSLIKSRGFKHVPRHEDDEEEDTALDIDLPSAPFDDGFGGEPADDGGGGRATLNRADGWTGGAARIEL